MTFDKVREMPREVPKIELIKALESLNLPDDIVVTSASAIKVDTVKKVLKDLFPNRHFNVLGVKASSEINEQPVGIEETELGAKNRITSAEKLAEKSNEPRAFVSVENGIFKINNTQYEDKAVVVIKFPDGQIISSISPRGVIFPAEAVETTLKKEGGFKDHTVGSTIAEMFANRGIEINKQDPHSALTNNEFTREDQMISAIEETLKKAAAK